MTTKPSLSVMTVCKAIALLINYDTNQKLDVQSLSWVAVKTIVLDNLATKLVRFDTAKISKVLF